MRHLLRSMTLAAVAAVFATTGGCAPQAHRAQACRCVTLLPSFPTTHASEGPPSTPLADVSHVKIGNFGQVDAHYYRGEQPEDGDYAALTALGIRMVIDLQPHGGNDQEAQLVEAAGMTFHRIPMRTRVAPTLEQIAEFMIVVTNPANQPVYVHCAGGKHRTGVMTAVYRMEHDGWTAEQAYQEMKRYKFGSSIWHPEFKDFVYRYRPVRMYGSRQYSTEATRSRSPSSTGQEPCRPAAIDASGKISAGGKLQQRVFPTMF